VLDVRVEQRSLERLLDAGAGIARERYEAVGGNLLLLRLRGGGLEAGNEIVANVGIGAGEQQRCCNHNHQATPL
jgi:hypothetical protein